MYLNYPVSHSLVLTLPNGTIHDVNLEEDVLAEDPTTSYPNRRKYICEVGCSLVLVRRDSNDWCR